MKVKNYTTYRNWRYLCQL